tara:strand:+ start:242 stop:1273 length:1032 start_codon:yes stop_codon:yes gene_type:complete
MANGDFNASRLGLVNNTGTNFTELFLKVFANEVLTTFEEVNVMKDLHTVRTISSGKSAQFPITGVASAKYHTVGEDILESSSNYTSQIKHAERTINIDKVLLASTFIANIDEMQNHYDVRSIYSKELGKALAKRFDIATMKTLAATADSASLIGGNGGITINLGSTTGAPADIATAAKLIQALTLVAQKLDENDIPSGDRFAILKPADYYKLAGADSTAITLDSRFNAGTGGSLASGSVLQVAGIDIVKSTHLSDIAVAEASQDQDDDNSNNDVAGASGTGYNIDGSTLEFLAGHKAAIGTVKLMDLTTESEYIMTKQGTALVAKYAMGHGVLRPEAAVRVVT